MVPKSRFGTVDKNSFMSPEAGTPQEGEGPIKVTQYAYLASALLMLPHLRSLPGVVDRTAAPHVVRMLCAALSLALAHRVKKLRSHVERLCETMSTLVPLACVVAIIHAGFRRNTARLGNIVAFGSVTVISEAIASLWTPEKQVDVIAVGAIVLGLLLGHRSAAAVILLMVTGGEALEGCACG